MLTQTDYAVIAVYAALMVWIGMLAKRKSGNVEQYFAAGRRQAQRGEGGGGGGVI